MRCLVYQEVKDDITYSLFSRDLGELLIYDIEVETIVHHRRFVELIPAVSTDCQTSMLLTEMVIRNDVSSDVLLKNSGEFLEFCCPL